MKKLYKKKQTNKVNCTVYLLYISDAEEIYQTNTPIESIASELATNFLKVSSVTQFSSQKF